MNPHSSLNSNQNLRIYYYNVTRNLFQRQRNQTSREQQKISFIPQPRAGVAETLPSVYQAHFNLCLGPFIVRLGHVSSGQWKFGSNDVHYCRPGHPSEMTSPCVDNGGGTRQMEPELLLNDCICRGVSNRMLLSGQPQFHGILPTFSSTSDFFFKNSFKYFHAFCFASASQTRAAKLHTVLEKEKKKKKLKWNQRKRTLPEIAGPLKSFDYATPGKSSPFRVLGSDHWDELFSSWGGSKQDKRTLGRERTCARFSGDNSTG